METMDSTTRRIFEEMAESRSALGTWEITSIVLRRLWPQFLIWATLLGRPALIPITNRERRSRCCRQLDLMRFVPHGVSLYVPFSQESRQVVVHYTIGFFKYFTSPTLACLSTICCKVIECTTLIRGYDNWKQETRTRRRQRQA